MDRMHRAVAAIVVGAASACGAQPVAQAPVKTGDTWVYLVRNEEHGKETTLRKYEWSATRVTSRNLVVSIRAQESNLPPREEFLNPDWSKSVSMKGHETLVRKPFDFPLAPGNTWTIKWEDDTLGPAVKFERDELQYRVVGWEDVKVPAGTFKALKIEADGSWYKEFNEQGPAVAGSVTSDSAGSSMRSVARKPFTPAPATGRRYQAWWYVPEIKREVKFIIENSGSKGDLGNRETAELDKFTPAP